MYKRQVLKYAAYAKREVDSAWDRLPSNRKKYVKGKLDKITREAALQEAKYQAGVRHSHFGMDIFSSVSILMDYLECSVGPQNRSAMATYLTGGMGSAMYRFRIAAQSYEQGLDSGGAR